MAAANRIGFMKLDEPNAVILRFEQSSIVLHQPPPWVFSSRKKIKSLLIGEEIRTQVSISKHVLVIKSAYLTI
jgi:hypothetical protein